MLEAVHLKDDLYRAGIEPWGWIINASLAAAETKHPLLRQRAASEGAQFAKVRDVFSPRYAVMSLQTEEPVGRDHLIALCRTEPQARIEGCQRVDI